MSQELTRCDCPHQIRGGDRITVEIGSTRCANLVRDFCQQAADRWVDWNAVWRVISSARSRSPVVFWTIVVCVALYPAGWRESWGGLGEAFTWLSIVNADLIDGRYIRYASLHDTMMAGQWWRLVTPALVHFSIVHLLLNLTFWFLLGWRIELAQGSMRLLGLSLAFAVISNLGQFVIGGSPLFGGLSGVVYGLLGYLMVWGWRRHPVLTVPRGLAAPALATMVILTAVDGFGWSLPIAHGAHWTGFAAGVVIGFLVPGSARPLRLSDGRHIAGTGKTDGGQQRDSADDN